MADHDPLFASAEEERLTLYARRLETELGRAMIENDRLRACIAELEERAQSGCVWCAAGVPLLKPGWHRGGGGIERNAGRRRCRAASGEDAR